MRTRSTAAWTVALMAGALIVAALTALWWHANGPLSVTMAHASRGPLVASFSADGFVESASVEIVPRIAATVLAVPVREGEHVAAGGVLVRLDDREALAAQRAAAEQAAAALAAGRQARAAVAEAIAQQHRAEAGETRRAVDQALQRYVALKTQAADAARQSARMQRLFRVGAVARVQLEQAQTQAGVTAAQAHAAQVAYAAARAASVPNAQVAAAQVSSARAAFAQSQASAGQAQAALVQARTVLSYSTIVAPFDGVVGRVRVNSGDLASPDAPVVNLVTRRRLRVRAEFDEDDVAKLHTGGIASVLVPGYPGRALRGTIGVIAAEAGQQPDASWRTRVLDAEIWVDDPAHILKPRMRVDVEGMGEVTRDAVLVPADALTFVDGRDAVYAIERGRAYVRFVRVGVVTDRDAEMLGGIEPGDTVVVDPPDGLRNGRLIRGEPAR